MKEVLHISRVVVPVYQPARVRGMKDLVHVMLGFIACINLHECEG